MSEKFKIEENPLELYTISNRKKGCSGRPRKSDEIIFSSPPKSIVSLLLRKEKIVTENIECITNIDTKSSQSTEKMWICRKCPYRCNSKEDLKEHKISHKNQLHSCDYLNCSYSTKSSSNLIKHKRTHTSEKPYICDQCLFRTNFQNSLTVHKRIHTAERPYACQHCNYRCNSSSNLKKHCANRHY